MHAFRTYWLLACSTVIMCIAISPASSRSAHKPPKKAAPAPSVQKGVDWLAAAQHADGGWGAGSHAAQRIRDPHAVKTDPGTTAFAGLALLRAGAHPEAVARATDYVVRAVEAAPEAGPLITDITGTQPQRKLGPYIDTVLTVQFLSRVVENLPAGSDRMKRVRGALEGCVRKLQAAQTGDGSWGADRGWAPVLQSSLATSALEMASVAETDVNPESLNRARDYQKGRFDVASGRASGEGVAGVELYSLASAKRANAARARYAMSAIEEAKAKGDLPDDAAVNEENLNAAGVPAGVVGGLVESFREADLQGDRLANDDALLRGFGSNGGEEYLSYLQMSEALVIEGGDEWLQWKEKMHRKLEKIQSPDGSWTGHHCITSPVFSTSAVVQTLTADLDEELLRKAATLLRETSEP